MTRKTRMYETTIVLRILSSFLTITSSISHPPVSHQVEETPPETVLEDHGSSVRTPASIIRPLGRTNLDHRRPTAFMMASLWASKRPRNGGGFLMRYRSIATTRMIPRDNQNKVPMISRT